jgi:breast cancer 2 susceptibility protein
LRAELDKKSNLLGGYADRLERRAGLRFCPAEDGTCGHFCLKLKLTYGPLESAPDHIDNLYDDLDDASKAAKIIACATTNEAGWLARYIREKALRDQESAGEEVEHELQVCIFHLSVFRRVTDLILLQKICPLREVRNFRVLVVRDAYSNKRPSHRQAQLTVWDALSLSHSEGSKAGSFEAGQRFMVSFCCLDTCKRHILNDLQVTNLIPTQPNAWMSRHEIESEVYLSSRRDSRWTRLK